MARAAGILIDWDDFGDLSDVTPLLARIYPNGGADVNHFHAAGGMAFLVRELLGGRPRARGRADRRRRGLRTYAPSPCSHGGLAWREAPAAELRHQRPAPRRRPVQPPTAVSRSCAGNLGRAVIKVSAVEPEHRVIEAPARVFDDQEDVLAALPARRARTATSWRWSASRARAPTACRSCTA